MNARPFVMVREKLFHISMEEATFARRGFRRTDPVVERHLEQVGRTFLTGYHVALAHDPGDELAAALAAVEPALRGFAYEGAAMALALMDQLLPWRRDRLDTFLAGPATAHVYMVHVGAGWALARLRRRVEGPLRRMDGLLGWLAVDGFGFHEGYFHPDRFVIRRERPRRLSGYALRAFDQGLGRSLWFVEGADVDAIRRAIEAFEPDRHADLWSGVGLACAYAGGVDRNVVGQLRSVASDFAPAVAQGTAFAVTARQRAGNPVPHTDVACEVLCGCSPDEAAAVTLQATEDLPPDGVVPSFEVWRQCIQSHFQIEEVHRV